jgi:hypothetical protein
MQTIVQKTDTAIKQLDKAAGPARVLILLSCAGLLGGSGLSTGLEAVAIGIIIGLIVGILVANLFSACIDWMRQLLVVQTKILLELERGRHTPAADTQQ